MDGNVDTAWVNEPGVKALNDEAIRLVLLLDGWEPGKLNGKPVTCQYSMPVTFNITTAAERRKERREERRRRR